MRRQIFMQTGDRQIEFWVRAYRATTYRYDSTVMEFVTLNAPENRTVLKSLRVMHDNVNGIAFGSPGASGQIVEVETTARRGSYSLGFRQTLHWVAPPGQILLTEVRTARIAPGPCDGCLLDLTLEFCTPDESAITFGHSEAAFLAGSIPSSLLPAGGGQIRNSLGLYGIDALNGQNATWIGAMGVVQNETVGFVWLDHPKNPWYPTLWQLNSDGLLSPSPFAWREETFPPATSLLLRYRLLAHRGYVEQGWADARLAEFARSAPPA